MILDDLGLLALAERPDFVQPVATDLRRLTEKVTADTRDATGRTCEIDACAQGAAATTRRASGRPC